MRETNDDLEISAGEVLAILPEIQTGTLVDVRETWEVERGMLPGAVHYPMSAFQDHLEKLIPTKEYIIYCAHGVRSLDVAAWLQQNLNIQARSMAGGIALWQGPLVIPESKENS